MNQTFNTLFLRFSISNSYEKTIGLYDWPNSNDDFKFEDITGILIQDAQFGKQVVQESIKSYIPEYIDKFLNINELGLKVSNITIPESINKLNITKLRIFENYPHQIHHLHNLKELYIRKTGCVLPYELNIPSFIGLNTLKELTTLEIEGWKFGDIPKELFELTKLQHLKIITSDISKIPDDICKLNELITLDIYSHCLVHISDKINELSSLTNLKIFGPVENMINELSLPNLEKLELSSFKNEKVANLFTLAKLIEFRTFRCSFKKFGNEIYLPKIKKILSLGTFIDKFNETDCFPMLEELLFNNNCDKNKLTNKIYEIFPDNYCLPMLKSLSIRNNFLTTIPQNLNFPMLESVDFSHNELENITLFAPNLKTLWLQGNKLKDISGINAPKLEYLNVSNNKIDTMIDFTFSPNLRTVYFQNNLITKMPDSFYELKNIKILHLHYNNNLILSNKISKMLSVSDLRIDCKKRKYICENYMLLASSNEPTDYEINENITHLTMFGKYDEQEYRSMDDEPIWYDIIDGDTQINFLNNLPYDLKYLKITCLDIPITNLPVSIEVLSLPNSLIDIDSDIKIPFGVKIIED